MNTENIFGETKLWKNRYRVTYCELCEGVEIICPDCGNISCNGGSCDKCHDDFVDYCQNCKSSEWHYLNDEERKTFRKISYLRRYIMKSVKEGLYQINWKKMQDEGELCQLAEEIFEKELKDL